MILEVLTKVLHLAKIRILTVWSKVCLPFKWSQFGRRNKKKLIRLNVHWLSSYLYTNTHEFQMRHARYQSSLFLCANPKPEFSGNSLTELDLHKNRQSLGVSSFKMLVCSRWHLKACSYFYKCWKPAALI